MPRNEPEPSSSESFADTSSRRPLSLCTTQESYQRLKKHSSLQELADKTFKSAEDVIDKFDSLNRNYEVVGKWSLTTEVEAKLDTFKETLASDQSEGHENFWNFVQSDFIVANQQMRMNEVLLKTNADIKCQLALAKEIFSKTQTDAVETLRGVVKDALELLKAREDEACHWKMKHHESAKQCEALQKDLKILQKKTDDTQAKLGDAENECLRLQHALEDTEALVKEHETRIKKLEQDLQETRKKNQLLKGEVDQKTDELASLDTDIRQAVQEREHLQEKHKKDLEKYHHNFETKMTQELDKQAKHMDEDYKKQIEHLQSQYQKLNNEREMLFNKVDEYKSALEEVRRENDYLKRNSKQIKQDLLAQCQRRVFSALNYETQSSTDSSPPVRYAPVRRSRSVAFNEENRDRLAERPQPQLPVEPVVQPKQPCLPVRPEALPAVTSQIRKRPAIFNRRT